MLNEGITESGQEILKEGYLVKQGHIVKNWKRRWFVLTAGSIDYFETQGGVQKGRILLDNVTISLDVDALGKEHCFGLTAESLVDKAMEIEALGGTVGGIREPTRFIQLTLKMLMSIAVTRCRRILYRSTFLLYKAHIGIGATILSVHIVVLGQHRRLIVLFATIIAIIIVHHQRSSSSSR